MKRLVMVLIGLSLACGQPQQVVSHQSPSQSPASVLACRLPINTGTGGAWLELPSGTITADPAAEFISDPTTHLVRSVQTPVLTGYSGSLFYSRSAKRWLPTSRGGVSPDGLRYAYADWSAVNTKAQLHVVEVASGNETSYALPDSHFVVFDFGSGAVYLTFSWEGVSGLWRVELATGAFSKVANLLDVWAGDGDTVWAGSVNPDDPHPLVGISVQPDQVDRVTIANGNRQTWFYRPVTTFRVIAVDGEGDPIVEVFAGKDTGNGLYTTANDPTEFFELTAPGSALHLALPATMPSTSAIDSHGLWLGGAGGIYLLRKDGTLSQVSTTPGDPAGGCI